VSHSDNFISESQCQWPRAARQQHNQCHIRQEGPNFGKGVCHALRMWCVQYFRKVEVEWRVCGICSRTWGVSASGSSRFRWRPLHVGVTYQTAADHHAARPTQCHMHPQVFLLGMHSRVARHTRRVHHQFDSISDHPRFSSGRPSTTQEAVQCLSTRFSHVGPHMRQERRQAAALRTVPGRLVLQPRVPGRRSKRSRPQRRQLRPCRRAQTPTSWANARSPFAAPLRPSTPMDSRHTAACCRIG